MNFHYISRMKLQANGTFGGQGSGGIVQHLGAIEPNLVGIAGATHHQGIPVSGAEKFRDAGGRYGIALTREIG